MDRVDRKVGVGMTNVDDRNETKEVACASARFLAAGKAANVEVLAVGEMTLIADYFVIASGSTRRQVKALADAVFDGLRPQRKPSHIEGYEAGAWILLDYRDVVVHIFREEERSFYGLERLWGDAPRLEWEDPAESDCPSHFPPPSSAGLRSPEPSE